MVYFVLLAFGTIMSNNRNGTVGKGTGNQARESIPAAQHTDVHNL